MDIKKTKKYKKLSKIKGENSTAFLCFSLSYTVFTEACANGKLARVLFQDTPSKKTNERRREIKLRVVLLNKS